MYAFISLLLLLLLIFIKTNGFALLGIGSSFMFFIRRFTVNTLIECSIILGRFYVVSGRGWKGFILIYDWFVFFSVLDGKILVFFVLFYR